MIRLEFPKPLPSVNTFWSSPHWSRRSRHARAWHDLAAVVVAEAGHPVAACPVGAVVTCYNVRGMDASNVCYKPLEDGLVKAGVLPDDSPEYVAWVKVESVRVRKKAEQRTVVELVSA